MKQKGFLDENRLLFFEEKEKETKITGGGSPELAQDIAELHEHEARSAPDSIRSRVDVLRNQQEKIMKEALEAAKVLIKKLRNPDIVQSDVYSQVRSLQSLFRLVSSVAQLNYGPMIYIAEDITDDSYNSDQLRRDIHALDVELARGVHIGRSGRRSREHLERVDAFKITIVRGILVAVNTLSVKLGAVNSSDEMVPLLQSYAWLIRALEVVVDPTTAEVSSLISLRDKSGAYGWEFKMIGNRAFSTMRTSHDLLRNAWRTSD